MTKGQFVCTFSVLVLGCAVGLVVSSRAAEQGATAGQGGAGVLEGKYLAIEVDRALDDHSTWLKNPHVQTMGGDTFLTGKWFSVSKDGKEEEGGTVCVSMHHIEQILVYDSFDEVKKATEDSDK